MATVRSQIIASRGMHRRKIYGKRDPREDQEHIEGDIPTVEGYLPVHMMLYYVLAAAPD
jgi:hypothetical protein